MAHLRIIKTIYTMIKMEPKGKRKNVINEKAI